LLNLMNEESKKAEHILLMLGGLSRLPVELTLSVYMLFSLFGISFLVSLVPLLVSLLLNSWLAKIRKILQKESLRLSDVKSNEINETLTNAKMLKMYGWQE